MSSSLNDDGREWEWVEKISRPDPHKTIAPLFFLRIP